MPKHQYVGDLIATSAHTAKGPRSAALLRERERRFQLWSDDPWEWMTGRDPHLDPTRTDERPIIWTKDEAAQADKGELVIKPFPGELEYIEEWVRVLQRETFITVDKARQMYMTTSTLLFVQHNCAFRDARRWVLSRSKEESAIEFLKDKVRFVHDQMPDWLRARIPCRKKPEKRVDFPKRYSYILAAAQNVAASEARGGTCSGVLVDEGAFQDLLSEILSACIAMATKIIMLSSPDWGTPGSKTYQEYL